MEEIIRNFAKQLEYAPEIENAAALKRGGRFIVAGMGGSNLAAEIIRGWKPKLDIVVHRDYGLPDMEERELKERLVVLSSYSGETEETVSAFDEAFSRGLPLIVISTGGKLLELAQKNNVPYIQLPDIKTRPRFAIGLSIKATVKAMGEESVLNDISGGAGLLDAGDYKKAGEDLARGLKDKIPLIYSSGRNRGLAYFWKVNFNETAKIPVFFSIFPELNHNEMTGFNKLTASGFDSKFRGKLADEFAFVFLTDPDDEPRIQKRMAATTKVFEERGFMVLKADVAGPSLWHKSFAGILTSFWVAYYLAEYYGVDPEETPMIENFKTLI